MAITIHPTARVTKKVSRWLPFCSFVRWCSVSMYNLVPVSVTVPVFVPLPVTLVVVVPVPVTVFVPVTLVVVPTVLVPRIYADPRAGIIVVGNYAADDSYSGGPC